MTGVLENKIVPKIQHAAAFVYGVLMAAVLPATASATTVTVNDLSGKTTDQLVGSIIGQVLTLARYVGVMLLVFGFYQLYISFKDDNPDGKIKAITICVTAVGLMTIKSILEAVGVIS